MSLNNKGILFFQEIANELSPELGHKPEVIYACLKAEFGLIKNVINSIDVEVLNDDDLSLMETNFNIKYIGKFSLSPQKAINWRKRLKHIKENENKKD